MLLLFFFFKQKTAYEMRISDWSSDVCSSDLYSFQHQQFQEWYASHYIERLMLQAVSDPTASEKLKVDVLDQRPWEEAILFAVERSARGDAIYKAACSAAIRAAFEVDPVLAGEMIFRATDEVWAPYGDRKSVVLGKRVSVR